MFPNDEAFYKEVITRFQDGTCWNTKAIRMLMGDNVFEPVQLDQHFNVMKVKRKQFSNDEMNQISKCLYRALNDLGFLYAASRQPKNFKTFIKQSIVAYYYAANQCASAVLLSYNKSINKKHKHVSDDWVHSVAKYFPYPLNLTISDITPSSIRAFESVNQRRTQANTSAPRTHADAMKHYNSFLCGTAEDIYEMITSKIKSDLNVLNLTRTVADPNAKKAKAEIKARAQNSVVGLLHCMYRMRVKAQYKDAVYLGYSLNSGLYQEMSRHLLLDMVDIINKMFVACYRYAVIRTGNEDLLKFEDVEKSSFEVPENVLEIFPRSA